MVPYQIVRFQIIKERRKASNLNHAALVRLRPSEARVSKHRRFITWLAPLTSRRLKCTSAAIRLPGWEKRIDKHLHYTRWDYNKPPFSLPFPVSKATARGSCSVSCAQKSTTVSLSLVSNDDATRVRRLFLFYTGF